MKRLLVLSSIFLLAACGGGGDEVATHTVCRPPSDSYIVTPSCWTEPVKPPATATTSTAP